MRLDRRPGTRGAAGRRTAGDRTAVALGSPCRLAGGTPVNCITAANQWAVDVGLAARLDIGQEGYLALQGMDEPAPYLAGGHFL